MRTEHIKHIEGFMLTRPTSYHELKGKTYAQFTKISQTNTNLTDIAEYIYKSEM